MPRTHDVSRTRRTGHLMDRPDVSPAVETSWQPPSWMEDGRCVESGLDPELWYADARSTDTKEAKRLCRACPVAPECLQFALDRGITDGTWGGLDEGELRRIAAARTQKGTKRRKGYHIGKPVRKQASA